jgi:uncharacterized repeat protein (TIGR03803 family)
MKRPLAAIVLTVVSIFFIAAGFLPASATEQTIYSFKGAPDGQSAYNGLIADKNGNLYGTTVGGGESGFGVVFELTSSGAGWTETVLYNFQGLSNNDGENPWAALVMDAAGNLYGTTQNGGGYADHCNPDGCGTVFELSPPAAPGGVWTETVLYRFQNSDDGAFPYSNLIFDQAGNLYSTARLGGMSGVGTVYELSLTDSGQWTLRTLHSFRGTNFHKDGAFPLGGLVSSSDGTLYGTTEQGGFFGNGTVYRLAQNSGVWIYHKVFDFNAKSSGQSPLGNLAMDKTGNLYGTTSSGGAFEFGMVFELSPPTSGSGLAETILYSFQGGADGDFPAAGVIFDQSGNLYGTTSAGGGKGSPYQGTVFKLSPPTGTGGAWNETVLQLFGNPGAGTNPSAGLIFGKSGSLYGTTPTGGADHAGVVFRIAP